MSKPLTLAVIDKELKRLGITSKDKEYVVAQILLAGLECGPNAEKIAKFIKQPRKTVREVGKRLRSNGIWEGRKLCCGWFEKENGGVGMGWLSKVEKE